MGKIMVLIVLAVICGAAFAAFCPPGLDDNGDGSIANSELLDYIRAWYLGEIESQDLFNAVGMWRRGEVCEACHTGADIDGDGMIDDTEILAYVDLWYNGEVLDELIMEAIGFWVNGSGC